MWSEIHINMKRAEIPSGSSLEIQCEIPPHVRGHLHRLRKLLFNSKHMPLFHSSGTSKKHNVDH